MLVFEITPAYTEVLAQMHRQCFDTYWDEAQFIQLLSLPTTHGLMCECGFILFSTVLDEAEIMTFCVLPQSRRMGIGRLLLSHMIEWAKTHHMHRIFLEVSEENLPARHLYEQVGFVFLSKRPHYYQTPDGFKDALCLVKKIK